MVTRKRPVAVTEPPVPFIDGATSWSTRGWTMAFLAEGEGSDGVRLRDESRKRKPEGQIEAGGQGRMSNSDEQRERPRTRRARWCLSPCAPFSVFGESNISHPSRRVGRQCYDRDACSLVQGSPELLKIVSCPLSPLFYSFVRSTRSEKEKENHKNSPVREPVGALNPPPPRDRNSFHADPILGRLGAGRRRPAARLRAAAAAPPCR